MVLDMAKPKNKKSTIWPRMRGRDAPRKWTLKVNILQAFTIDFSEIQFVVNHNSQSDGQNKSAKSWTNLQKKIIHIVSLLRKRQDTKDNGISPWTNQAKMGLWNFDPIFELLSLWKTVYTTSQANNARIRTGIAGTWAELRRSRFLHLVVIYWICWGSPAGYPLSRVSLSVKVSRFLIFITVSMRYDAVPYCGLLFSCRQMTGELVSWIRKWKRAWHLFEIPSSCPATRKERRPFTWTTRRCGYGSEFLLPQLHCFAPQATAKAVSGTWWLSWGLSWWYQTLPCRRWSAWTE